jgi:nicotinamidase-related amidase
MAENDTLRFRPLTETCVHLCVDMQQLFAEDTEWHTPWMDRVRPKIHAISEARPGATIFTRFIPAKHPGEGRGTWKRYYKRWASMTLERLAPELVGLLPELAALVPPAVVFDKQVYSPWIGGDLDRLLQRRGIAILLITGGETDVCVLSTVLGAVDRGYRIVIATDALCSSSDEAHDAMMTLYHTRYGQQVETVDTKTALACWTWRGSALR